MNTTPLKKRLATKTEEIETNVLNVARSASATISEYVALNDNALEII